jgi:4-hydroxy-tetrahydrodipicolinate reductase
MNLEVFSACSDVECVGAIEDENSPSLGQDAGTVAGVHTIGIPITADLEKCIDHSDVVVDFTTTEASLDHLRIVRNHGKAAVIGTTGFSDKDLDYITEQSNHVPIVLSPNMSLGINTLFHLVRIAAEMLGTEFDTEIVEIHHNMKKDAPSGTALEFGRVIAEARGKRFGELAVFGREGLVGARKKDEIGIAALRAGDAVGDHQILFGGTGERIELIHRSSSRKNYAMGALRAARFVVQKERGLFTMANVLGFN